MKKALVKIFNVIIDIVIILVLIVSILIVTLSLTSKSAGVSNILGVAPLSVRSNSMEDTFSTGDLLLSQVTNDPGETYEVGDIVTFPIEIDGESVLNTHRIVEVVEDDSITYYRTQGDNKDTNPVPDEDLQSASTIVAKYTGTKISGIGNVLTFIRTQLGFFLCVLLPMIIFFVYEAIRVVMNIIAYNNEKALNAAKETVQNSELTEEQKKKAIEEYLASIEQNKKDDSLVQTPAEDE
ncbi:MAG TPA: signal peptidase I [Ruminococcus sp.]|nr:signal peptidase I [Ruminococcus sp.]